MTKKTTTKKPPAKKLKAKKEPFKVVTDRRREWRFELPLSALVEGNLPKGTTFKERIILQNISSGGAYFCLDSGITVGSKLNLVIDLPTKLTGGKKTKLCLGGLTVRLKEADESGKTQGVALCFDEVFEFMKENSDDPEETE